MHENYMESFSYAQMYEFLTFHTYITKFHGQKTSSDLLHVCVHIQNYVQPAMMQKVFGA